MMWKKIINIIDMSITVLFLSFFILFLCTALYIIVILDSSEREAFYPILKQSIYLRVIPNDLPPDVTDIYVKCDMKRIYPYLLRFNFSYISPECREVNEKYVLYPYSIFSPNWWPKELTSTTSSKNMTIFKLSQYYIFLSAFLSEELTSKVFPKNRTKYKFYQCDSILYKDGITVYYAIDYNAKTGYFWQL
ncbi:hypothetical protein [Candidatus Magnetominusculus xianensis]|uniref:Secreted protein n=1 Tax=Candidatus Magnetominusculus xianensis TaxID=1748249 RepID=A0ABR5SEQ4_9BACT|nr:hypothetical protein [Candidatus Magnetominusculus xianensis]KWT84995.1 hypothetical protein ASN18_1813 [Candidatus Magnetominusculus xianensis]MBF0404538.1 hypothetical protein [Nitrospirota bacterium]